MLRTHTAGELTKANVGQSISLCGWVDQLRDIGQLVFLSLRDRYGVTQCVFESANAEHPLLAKLKSLGHEFCVRVDGVVRMRSEKDINRSQPSGEIEVVIDELTILNESCELPFQVRDDVMAADDLRLKFRYLDLRRPKMQRNLQIRHQVVQATREALSELGFLEIETPMLIRSTPEGARDFVVPSRLHPGKFYALPQSPQLYKQMLMISGCDRYFQFAQAFRDEDLRADRVPVHTQIDMEMSFVEEKDVFAAVEKYMSNIFMKVKGIKLDTPFHIMSYQEAMDRFGCDKPDTRFALELKTITELAYKSSFGVFKDASCVRCLVVPNGESVTRKDLDGELADAAKIYGAKGLAWTRVKEGSLSGGIGKFLSEIEKPLLSEIGAQEGALILFVAASYNRCCAALSAVRLKLAAKLDLIDHSQFNFLWVNDFPLFEWDEDRKAYNAMHHLFTMPKVEDIQYLDSDPGRVRGQLYDLVLNGVELCSGSIRINRPEIQSQVIDIVGMPKEEAESKFGFLLESFKYGAPPHGGSAVGLDRLVAILCGESSIREVIAYPCNNVGVFPLDNSPAQLNPQQLGELKLSINPSQDA
ncbi:MAG: aspartate--tRNA ligase [Bdellovibrionota bacterium]